MRRLAKIFAYVSVDTSDSVASNKTSIRLKITKAFLRLSPTDAINNGAAQPDAPSDIRLDHHLVHAAGDDVGKSPRSA